MIIVVIAAVCVAAGVGTGVLVSKKRFNNNIADADCESTSSVAQDKSLSDEMDRFEQLKINIVTVKKNIEKLDIPMPEKLTSWDDAESSLNKLSKFLEKHSKSATGTEAFILSILPVSQTGEILCSFASTVPDFLSGAFSNSVSALKAGAAIPGVDDITTCLTKFCEGMVHTSPKALAQALQHHDYIGGLLAPVKNGFAEMFGVNAATNSLKESFHEFGGVLTAPTEVNVDLTNSIDMTDLTDLTDFDFSGHIPVMTIAVSSFREFNLLMDNKTDAMTSLKNIGLDAAGAGGGGLVGAKAGALAGSLFGPVGTLIGGIAGGICGAMGGRALTNEIKQKPLKNAIEAYQSNANQMKEETRNKSRNMLESISNFTSEKRKAFKNDKMLKEIPVVENESTVISITLILYQAVTEHMASMKQKVDKMKSSFWYSDNKYGIIVENYEKRIANIERQLPPIKNIEANPKLALETLLALQIPTQKAEPIYKKKFMECSKELKEMNDKNNSSILVWSYMVNGLYQKTLNEITNFSNTQMTAFNQFVEKWKQTMSSLENKVNVEKGKLGLK